MKEKTLLFITSRLPFPAISGRKNSLFYYCKIIKKYGYKVIVASFDDKSDLSQKPDFIDEVILLPNPSSKTKLKNLLIDSFIKRKFPMQVSLYWDKKIDKIIKNIEYKYKPSIVIADMVRTTEYLNNIDSRVYTVADLDDRLSLRYQRQLDYNLNDVNPYGVFLSSLPKFIQFFLMINFIKKYVMKNEIKLLKKYELSVGQKTNCTVFVSYQETKAFNDELGKEKAITIPIGVDTNYFNYVDTDKFDDYIGFLGVLNVAHNENAIKTFVKDIFPKILEKNSNAKFLVIGGGASSELKKLESDSIIFTGRVDDVRDYLRKCKVFVCPLKFGSGIKTKNLEAMSLGISVVTTSIGAENIDAVDGEDWLIANENSDFAEKTLMILSNKEYRKKLEKNGSQYIRNNFTWDVAEEKFKQILK